MCLNKLCRLLRIAYHFPKCFFSNGGRIYARISKMVKRSHTALNRARDFKRTLTVSFKIFFFSITVSFRYPTLFL